MFVLGVVFCLQMKRFFKLAMTNETFSNHKKNVDVLSLS